MDIESEARRLIDLLPEQATWDDLMQFIYVRESVDAGLRAADEGRTVPVDEVRARFGLRAAGSGA